MKRRIAVAAGVSAALAATVAIVRHGEGGHRIEGGIVMNDAAGYERHTGWLLGGFYRGIAADIASVAPSHGRVLEVGCGPGRLARHLAHDHGLEVTGIDLDPAMVERARAAAGSSSPRPTFIAADVAALPFEDASFDVVVSTLSMHHWEEPRAGLAEIGRVLRPDGRALVWDVRAGVVPLHREQPDPATHFHGSALQLVRATPWRWPWRLSWTQRFELRAAEGAGLS